MLAKGKFGFASSEEEDSPRPATGPGSRGGRRAGSEQRGRGARGAQGASGSAGSGGSGAAAAPDRELQKRDLRRRGREQRQHERDSRDSRDARRKDRRESEPADDEDHDGPGNEGAMSDSGGMKRKRPKYIRKVECMVCGDIANDHIHYGAIACYSCRAFFRRGVHATNPYYCSQEKSCNVTKQTRKHCQHCRFQKCLSIGMKPSWVMSEEDKQVKKEKAAARKQMLMAKKAEKQMKKSGTGPGSPVPSTSGLSVASPASLYPASSSSEITAPSPEMSAPSPSSSHSTSADSPHVVAQIDSPGTVYSSFSLGSPSICASGSPIDYSTRRSRQSPPRWSSQPRSPRTLPPPPSSAVVFPASPSSSVSAHSPSPYTSRSCSRTLSVSVDVTTNQDEPMSPGRLPLHSMTIGDIQQPMTHESGYASIGRSPGCFGPQSDLGEEEDDLELTNYAQAHIQPQQRLVVSRHRRPQQLLVQRQQHTLCQDGQASTALESASAQGSTSQEETEDIQMIENVDLGRDMAPYRQPAMVFTNEEGLLIDGITAAEVLAAQVIKVPSEVMHSFIQAARTGRPVPYQTTLDGYTVCMRRIIKFAGDLECFREFSMLDQRNLLLANTDMLVNIKSARMLKPGVNLQDQLAFAIGSLEGAKGCREVAQFSNATGPPLDCNQIYQTPWASSLEDERRFKEMMSKIFDLKMDRITTTLMELVALFSVSHAELQNRERAISIQEFFSNMLFRYLCWRIGRSNATALFPKYMMIMEELEKMAQIMISKRLNLDNVEELPIN